jgi:hypothetical protein
MPLIFFSWIRMYGSSSSTSHRFGIGDEIWRQVATVELHALDDFEGGFEALRLFDSDDAFLTDLVHRIGDDVADRRITIS